MPHTAIKYSLPDSIAALVIVIGAVILIAALINPQKLTGRGGGF